MRNASLSDTLARAVREGRPPALCVAFSGGPDSTALLHALAQLPAARKRGLRALHVDHGLHPLSPDWAKHCARFCESLGVPLTTVRVEIGDSRGEGVEAAARRARRAAFAAHLHDAEWLALAHHRDDQVETVLLKLLRGAGPEGLGGMRVLRPFGRGFLWRPWLDFPREVLRDYLKEQNLSCLQDPANDDPRFARNVLRREILPRIATHWPHAETAILHSAELCRSAADYLDRASDAAFAALSRDEGTLDAGGWLALPDALRAPVLERWLRARGLPTTADAQRRELERQAADAAPDRVPCIAWRGAEVHVWDGRLHAFPPAPPIPANWEAAWDGALLALPGGGLLTVEPDDGAPATATSRFDPPLTVRFRHGGERIRPAGDPHMRELRDLFQRARIPPWLRARCPLIFGNGELVAVADLWISERGKAVFAARGVRPRWSPLGRLNEA